MTTKTTTATKTKIDEVELQRQKDLADQAMVAFMRAQPVKLSHNEGRWRLETRIGTYQLDDFYRCLELFLEDVEGLDFDLKMRNGEGETKCQYCGFVFFDQGWYCPNCGGC